MSSSSSAQRISGASADTGRRQLDDEGRPLVLHALHGDAPAVGLDDRLRDVEAEARARYVALEHGLAAEEALEQVAALRLRDPDPRVGDLDRDRAVASCDGDVDRAA